MIQIFEEFFKIIREFNEAGIQYVVVGGIAMAFHAEPRYTRDIDFLVLPEELPAIIAAFNRIGYFESSSPLSYQSNKLALHRFMRTEGEEFLIADILVGGEPEYRRIIMDAVLDQSSSGTVRLAGREDLIWLKQARNSEQDQVDIRRLRRDKN